MRLIGNGAAARIESRARLCRPAGFFILLAAVLSILAGCSNSTSSTSTTTPTPSATPSTAATAPATPLTIAVIPKGTTHSYWIAVHAGAVKAQEDLKAKGTNINVIWKGPLREDDRDGQIDIVQTFQTQNVSGIVLAPQDSTALVSSAESAVGAGIPVVIIDSALNSTKPVSFVATDNHKGGELAAQRLGTLLGGKGKVLMLRYMVGSASTEAREAGFLDGIGKFPGISVVSSNQYAGATVDLAYQSAQNLLSRYGNTIDGVFASNQSASLGMLHGLQDIGKAGKVKFIAFDSDPEFLKAMQAGQLQGFVVQNPFNMGYLGVTTVVQAIQKQPVQPNIDTGVTMVTPDNLNQPAIQKLLNPPIDQYLR